MIQFFRLSKLNFALQNQMSCLSEEALCAKADRHLLEIASCGKTKSSKHD